MLYARRIARVPIRMALAVATLATTLAVASGVEVQAAYESAPRIIATTTGVGTATLDLAVTPDGSRVYVAALLSGVTAIDTTTNAVSTSTSMTTGPFGIAVIPDGTKAYVSQYGASPQGAGDSVVRIDTDPSSLTYGTVIGAPISLGPPVGAPTVGPQGIAITPDGSRAYIANYGDGTGTPGYTVSVVDTVSNLLIATITLPSGSGSYSLAINPAGTVAYVANSAGTDMSVIDVNPASGTYNTVIASIAIGSGTKGVAFSPDGARAYATNDAGNAVKVIDTSTRAVIQTIPVGNTPIGVDVSPDGGRVYVANNASNSVSIIDSSTGTVTSTLTGFASPFDVAINPAGTRAYVSNNGDGTVTVIDTGWTPPASSAAGSLPPTIFTLALDPNQGSCWSSEVSGVANTWVTLPTTSACTRTGHVFGGWSTGRDGSGLTFAPGGQTFLTSDNSLYAIWHAPSSPAAPSTGPALTPGRAVVSAAMRRSSADPSIVTVTGTVTPTTSDATVRIWFRTRGNPVYQPSAEIPVRPDGTFTWTHRSNRRLYAYVDGGQGRSERVSVPRVAG